LSIDLPPTKVVIDRTLSKATGWRFRHRCSRPDELFE